PGVAHVGGNGECAQAVFARFGRSPLQDRRPTPAEYDGIALSQKGERRGSTNSRPRPRDECDLAVAHGHAASASWGSACVAYHTPIFAESVPGGRSTLRRRANGGEQAPRRVESIRATHKPSELRRRSGRLHSEVGAAVAIIKE